MQTLERHITPEVVVYTEMLGTVDIGRLVSSVTVKKSTRDFVASCNIVFQPSLTVDNNIALTAGDKALPLRAILKKNIPIAVKMNRNSDRWVFLGLIDHIGESTNYTGQPSRRIFVNCSMLLPKMLLRDNITNNARLETLPQIEQDPILKERAKFFKWERGRIGADTPFQDSLTAVKWILDNTIAMNPDIVLQTKISPSGQLKFNFSERDKFGKNIFDLSFLKNESLFDVNLTTYSGTILNYILSVIDKDWYEVFFDVTTRLDNTPMNTLTIRPKPFAHKGTNKAKDKWTLWEDIEQYKISRADVHSEQLGQSDYEVKNFFVTYFEKALLASKGSIPAFFGTMFPVINLKSVKRYGLRELTTTSTIANFEKLNKEARTAQGDHKKLNPETSESGKSMLEALREKRNKIIEWFAFPDYESGTITVTGDDKYTIGKTLFYEDRDFYSEEDTGFYKGVEYYIDEVLHKYTFPNVYVTDLVVSRGVPQGYYDKWFEKHDGDFIRVDEIFNTTQTTETSIDKKEAYEKRIQIIKELLPGIKELI